MALRKILTFPDKRLQEKAKPVKSVTSEILELLDDMAETMYAREGVGLAATQIGVPARVMVVDVTGAREGQEGLVKAINPELVSAEGAERCEEGCLSLPEVREEIERFTNIRVRYTDSEGARIERNCEGLLARAFQHEMDHLDGRLLLDRIGSIKRGLLKRRLKRAKETGEGKKAEKSRG